jgi:hypothetical protein
VAQVGAASEDAAQDSRTAPDFFDLDQRMMEDLDKSLSGGDLGICRQSSDVDSVGRPNLYTCKRFSRVTRL